DASKDATVIVLAVAAFFQTIFAGRMSTPSDDERLVLERASQLHLKMTRIFVRYSCALLCTGFALLQWRVARDVSLTTSSVVQGTMLSGLGVFMFIDSCPAILTVGRLNAFYVLVSLCATVSLSPWHVQVDRVVLMELSFLAFGRIPAVVIARTPALVVVCNLPPLLLALIRASTTSALDVSVVVEVSGFIATLCASVAVRLLVKSRVERNLQYGKMTADFNASSSLLQLICDSILELDADLQIAEHSPALAAMLLRDRPGTTLEGMDFTDLIPGAAEAGRAVELLRKFEDHPPDSLKAQAFHTHLVDSDANRFRTEVFQVTYHTLQGRVRHLIGLRDVTDQGSICGSKAVESLSIMPRTYTPMSAATCSSIESQPADGKRSSGTDTVRVARLDPSKIVSLEIDMNLQVVCTSSEPAYIGRQIGDVLTGEGLDLLETCWVESRAAHVALSFSALELRIHAGHPFALVRGTIQVVQSQNGSRDLLLVGEIPFCHTAAPEGSLAEYLVGQQNHKGDKAAEFLEYVTVISPLKAIGVIWVFAFLVYMSFTYFAVLNVVTAVFCQKAMDNAQNDHVAVVQSMLANKEAHLKRMSALFSQLGADEEGGVITFAMFEEKINSPAVKAYFETLGLDIWDAWSFFKLLDLDG
ncbi:CACNA1F, partial [Symbiodinium sp. KB8]